MAPSLQELLELSSKALGPAIRAGARGPWSGLGHLGQELAALLSERNGFYAFESALHVFPASAAADVMDLERWNAPDLWKDAYGDLPSDLLCFAEDAFGGQYALSLQGIMGFDPETGETREFAGSLSEWAQRILGDPEFETGYPLCHKWQRLHGALKQGRRLAPKVPFVLGGEFDATNLYEADAAALMRFRGSIAAQIRSYPDGTLLRLEVVDEPRGPG